VLTRVLAGTDGFWRQVPGLVLFGVCGSQCMVVLLTGEWQPYDVQIK
jgi:hypothetical protein